MRVVWVKSTQAKARLKPCLFEGNVDKTMTAPVLGAEDMRLFPSEIFEKALGEVQRFEGTVDEFLGDGFMAIFGAPLAYEDHAARAGLAAHAAMCLSWIYATTGQYPEADQDAPSARTHAADAESLRGRQGVTGAGGMRAARGPRGEALDLFNASTSEFEAIESIDRIAQTRQGAERARAALSAGG